MSGQHVVIVGAGLAGLRTAQALRRNGLGGPITMVGAESHPPYDRPPLSKGVLTGETRPEAVVYDSADALAAAGIQLRLGAGATGLDVEERRVRLSSGEQLDYDHVVLATGSNAHQPFRSPPAGVFTLRTLEDALTIRDALADARRLVIVGAGFVGLEIASSARRLGVQVTVVEATDRPLARSLGGAAADAVASLALRAGVTIACDEEVAGFTGAERLTGVTLSSGDVLDADLVVVGVGAVPNTAWLAGSGLPAGPSGVACTRSGRVVGHDRIWAVGDVAAWADAEGNPRRREHWTAAVEQATVVGANLPDDGARTLTAPDYVWSEQFGARVSLLGDTVEYDEVRLLDPSPESLVALYGRDGRLTGACAVGQMPLVLKCRRWITTCTPLDDLDLWHSAA